MNKLKWLIVLLFLLVLQRLSAQYSYEFKTDLLYTINLEPTLFLEVIPKDRLGIELGAHYYKSGRSVGFTDLSPITIIDSIANFSSKTVELHLAGKYYLLKDRKGYGMYIGPYSSAIFEFDLEDGYHEAYFTEYDQRVETYFWEEWQFGAIGGYKFLIKQKVAIDLGCSVAWNVLSKRVATITDGDLFIRVGWRFGKKLK